MAFRISPFWWPLLVLSSPVIIPFLARRNKRYRQNRALAKKTNLKRLGKASALDLPELDFLELTVLVEEKTKHGFMGDAGVPIFSEATWDH